MNQKVKLWLMVVMFLVVGIFIPFIGESLVYFSNHDSMSRREFFHLLNRAFWISIVVNGGLILIQRKKTGRSHQEKL